MTLRLLAHDTTTANYTSRATTVNGHVANERMFIVVFHGGGLITNISGGGTVFSDWTAHINGENAPVFGQTFQTRLSVFSCKRASAISGAITLVQGTSARLSASFYAGYYDVLSTFFGANPTVSGAPLINGYNELFLDLPDMAGPADKVGAYLIASVFSPIQTLSSRISPVGYGVDYLQGENSSTSMRPVVMQRLTPAGSSFGTGKRVKYAITTTTSNSHGTISAGLLSLEYVGPPAAYTGLYVPKSQQYNNIHPAITERGMVVPKSQSYIRSGGKGITVAKSVAYSHPPFDLLNQQLAYKSVGYLVAGLLPDDIQLVAKMAPYAVTGMDIVYLPQDVVKTVAYAVGLYDTSGRLFQAEDRQVGPTPPRWMIDELHPRIQINDGGFSLFAPTSGIHTLFILTDDDEFYSISLDIPLFTRVDIPFTQNFNQLALIRTRDNPIVSESVEKRMRQRRRVSTDF